MITQLDQINSRALERIARSLENIAKQLEVMNGRDEAEEDSA